MWPMLLMSLPVEFKRALPIMALFGYAGLQGVSKPDYVAVPLGFHSHTAAYACIFLSLVPMGFLLNKPKHQAIASGAFFIGAMGLAACAFFPLSILAP